MKPWKNAGRTPGPGWSCCLFRSCWLVSAAACLFTLGFALLPAMMAPQAAHAGWWDDLWARKDQQAYKALQQEQPELAAALAQDPALAGEGSYRSGDYAGACAILEWP